MNADDIRAVIKKYRYTQFEVAQEVGISEFTLSRWLRGVIPSERKDRILSAIERLRQKDETEWRLSDGSK